VVISSLKEKHDEVQIRKAQFIGRVKSFDELDILMVKYHVMACKISNQPLPHLVQAWKKQPHKGRDLSTGELRFHWTETGALDHYRHAHAFDHLRFV